MSALSKLFDDCAAQSRVMTHRIDGVHNVPLGARALDRSHHQHDEDDGEERAVRGRELVAVERVRVG